METNKNVQQFGENLVKKLSQIIQTTKKTLVTNANSLFLHLNWSIGKEICYELSNNLNSKWGEGVVQNVAANLSVAFGKCFSKANLYRMVQFYKEFQDFNQIEIACSQLTWSHFIELLPLEKTKRDFYLTLALNERWSVKELRDRKRTMLFERTALSKKPETTIAKELDLLRKEKKMNADIFFRDPYLLTFLDLKDTYSEKDLENTILVEIENFILEMGNDFSFLSRQKHFIVDGKDYFLDLLFYHRTLHRLVLIELKLGEFKPEYKGQVEFYLRWLDQNEKRPGENKPIALILCSEKSETTIQILGLDKGNIRVAQYLTKMPPRNLLAAKLNEAIKKAEEGNLKTKSENFGIKK